MGQGNDGGLRIQPQIPQGFLRPLGSDVDVRKPVIRGKGLAGIDHGDGKPRQFRHGHQELGNMDGPDHNQTPGRRIDAKEIIAAPVLDGGAPVMGGGILEVGQ